MAETDTHYRDLEGLHDFAEVIGRILTMCGIAGAIANKNAVEATGGLAQLIVTSFQRPSLARRTAEQLYGPDSHMGKLSRSHPGQRGFVEYLGPYQHRLSNEGNGYQLSLTPQSMTATCKSP